MRKNLLVSALISMAVLFGETVFADVVEYTTQEGIVYSVDTSAGTAVLKRADVSTNIADLIVPDEISYENNAYKVVEIGDQACAGNALLASVRIGANVTAIGVQSFYSCQSLAELNLSSSVKIIGDQAFYNCKNLISPVFPEGLEEIGSYAFWSNNAVTQVDLPASLVTIGSNPWGCCAALGEFTIADNAGNFAVSDGVLFDKDVSVLISYPIGRPVTEYATPATTRVIKDNSMRNNNFMTSITLNEGLEEIGVGAFNVCRFASITIPASVTTIGERAFASNPNLKEFNIEEGNENYAVLNKFLCTKDGKLLLQGVNIEDVVIPESVEDIEEYAFYNMSDIKTVKLSNTRHIGQSAFYSCRQISDIDFGTSLESVENTAFMYCSALKEVVFPSTFRKIANKQVFLGCMALEKLVLNEGIEEIGDAAFILCTALKEVYVPGSVSKMGTGVFSNCMALESIEFGEGMTSIGTSVASNNVALKTVRIADSVKDVGDFSFQGCTMIQEINLPASLETVGIAAYQNVPINDFLKLPENVVSVGTNAFTYCYLTGLETNDALQTIGDYAFGGNFNMETVTLNEGLVSIGTGAFASCQALTSLMIPSTVETLGNAFAADCTDLTEIVNMAVVPQVLEADPISPEGYETCVLEVPAGSVDAYGNAAFWMNFNKIEGVGSGVDNVQNGNVTVVGVYTLDGIPAENPAHGIYLVRYSDGTVRKIAID